MNYALIDSVKSASIAEELGIKKGDLLISINGQSVGDIIDYLIDTADEVVEIAVKHPDDTETVFMIEKEYDEDLGLLFRPSTITPIKRCANNCMFCFIAQMPKGLRPSLYLKDDDYRLSFLSGSYISGTNLQQHEIDRIKRLNLSPLYISVHQTQDRGILIGRNDDFSILSLLQDLSQSGICFHTQIVLCPGLNDGKILVRTLQDLLSLLPNLLSIAIVPVGLTKFRTGLPDLRSFSTAESRNVVNLTADYGDKLVTELGHRIVYASDEFYIKAQLPIPAASYYEKYEQLENGIGMLRLFSDQFSAGLDFRQSEIRAVNFNQKLVIASGRLAGSFLTDLLQQIKDLNDSFRYQVIALENMFFGPLVTVAGLIVGEDLMEYFKKFEDKSALVLIPRSMLQYNSNRFLDDITIPELEKAIGMSVLPVDVDGSCLLQTIIEKGVM